MQSRIGEELRERIREGEQIPIELIPEHEVYFKRIYDLFDPYPYTRSKLKWDNRKRPGVRILDKENQIFYKFDPHVIESTMLPFQAENFYAIKPKIKTYMFDVPQSVGLWPLRNWGMHHFQMDVDFAFDHDPLFYRNFWVYELSQQFFFELVGENIEARTLDVHLEWAVVSEFIKNVIDPLIIEWKRAPRILSKKEKDEIKLLFPKFKYLESDWLKVNRTKKEKNFGLKIIKNIMGQQIIRLLHEGLTYIMITQHHAARVWSTIPRNIGVEPFGSLPLRKTIEWRRIPGLKNVDEVELWFNYLIKKMEYIRKHKGLLYLRPPLTLSDAKQKIEFFNFHLMQIGLLPEDYRTFLLPEYQYLRVPIDICRRNLEIKLPEQFF